MGATGPYSPCGSSNADTSSSPSIFSAPPYTGAPTRLTLAASQQGWKLTGLNASPCPQGPGVPLDVGAEATVLHAASTVALAATSAMRLVRRRRRPPPTWSPLVARGITRDTRRRAVLRPSERSRSLH